MTNDPWAAWEEDENPFAWLPWEPMRDEPITVRTYARGESQWHERTIALEELTPEAREAAGLLVANNHGAWRNPQTIILAQFVYDRGEDLLDTTIITSDHPPTVDEADRLLRSMWRSYAEAWRERRDRHYPEWGDVIRRWSDQWQAQDELLARPAAEDELRVCRTLSPAERAELNTVFWPAEQNDRPDVYAQTTAVKIAELDVEAQAALKEWRETAAHRPEWTRDGPGPLVLRRYEYSYEHDAWYSTPYQSPDVSPAAISAALVEMVGSYREMVAIQAHEAATLAEYRREDELEALARSEPATKRWSEEDIAGELSPSRARRRDAGAGY